MNPLVILSGGLDGLLARETFLTYLYIYIHIHVYIWKTHMKTRHVFEEHLYFDRLVGLLQGE